MPDPLVFSVTGIPVPQGSMIGRLVNGHPKALPDNKEELLAWRRRVTLTAASLLQWRSGWARETPVDVRLLFEMERGKTITRPRPSARRGGDIDKLARALLDALQNAGVYNDDAQVVDLHVHQYYSPTPGVRVMVRDADLGEPPWLAAWQGGET